MRLMCVTKQPMSAYDEHAAEEGVTALLFPNSNFAPVADSQVYNDRLTEHQLSASSRAIDTSSAATSV